MVRSHISELHTSYYLMPDDLKPLVLSFTDTYLYRHKKILHKKSQIAAAAVATATNAKKPGHSMTLSAWTTHEVASTTWVQTVSSVPLTARGKSLITAN